ncbi:MAG: DUF2007 domain-containing protein [Proteobacteria bacterium]|nr:DUF2007 domain-containing protein [Pseudomonadota bacterium]
MYVELREFVICKNDLEAQIIKGLLQENQVEAYIQKDDCGGMEPQLQITEGIKVLVPSDQYQAAKTLIEAYQTSSDTSNSSGKTWECVSCGEQLEIQFSDCWKCGTPRGSIST